MDEYINFMIKVFRAKDLIKYCIILIITITIVYCLIRTVANGKQYSNELDKKIMYKIINENIGLIQKKEKDQELKSLGKTIINSEFDILKNFDKEEINTNDVIKKAEEKNNENNKEDKTNEEQKEEKLPEVKQAEMNVKTEVIENSVHPRYNREYKGVKINNSTDYELSDELLNCDEYQVNKEKILIYHTHTCESYSPTEENTYEASGNFRTTDLNYSVVRVGDELENQLKTFGYNVIHDKTYHDYPAYTGSYSRSLKTTENILKDNKDIDISIDIHRDAIGDSSYAPKVKIGEEYASQIMFVIGTDGGNPEHKDWKQNLKFAVKVQQKANEIYPGLFKPIILRKSEYNQHITKAACIIEVGATGNTLEESLTSMKYLAKIFELV